MQPAESIRFAGDVNIDYVNVVNAKGFGQNLSNQVVGISIYEDLFSPFITGKLTLRDSLDLMNLFPFVGDEFVDLSIRTPTFNQIDDVIRGRFSIYKISEREQINPGTYVYVLHFISVEAIVDINKKMSRAFDGKISNIVKDILTTEMGLFTQKDVNIEETPNGTKFVSNWWTPVKCLNYLAADAETIRGIPDFIFYENHYGFNFVSLQTLYDQKVYQSFVFDNYQRDYQTTSGTLTNIGESYRRVVDFSIGSGFNYLDNVRAGMYGSKMLSYDFITKKYVSKNYDALANFENSIHMGKYPIIAKNSISTNNSTIMSATKHYGSFNNYGDVTNVSTTPQRLSMLGMLDVYKVTIEVKGRSDYTVGQKVNLLLYKAAQIVSGEVGSDVDKLYSGNYIVTAINHEITRDEHRCSMELAKESLDIDLDRKN